MMCSVMPPRMRFKMYGDYEIINDSIYYRGELIVELDKVCYIAEVAIPPSLESDPFYVMFVTNDFNYWLFSSDDGCYELMKQLLSEKYGVGFLNIKPPTEGIFNQVIWPEGIEYEESLIDEVPAEISLFKRMLYQLFMIPAPTRWELSDYGRSLVRQLNC